MTLRRASSNRLKLRSAHRVAQAGTYTSTAATSISLTDVVSDRIYQRAGTSKDISVSGTYSGPASRIQARAVPHGTSLSSTAYEWMTIVNNPSGGLFSGLLTVPQGGWYNLQVRDGVNTSIAAGGTNRFGVGIVIALLGQSNMQNMWNMAGQYRLSDLLVRRFSAGVWAHEGNYDATSTYPPGTPSTTYGATYTGVTPRGDPAILFSNRLRASLGIPVGMLEYAVGGSQINSWVTGGGNWTTFASALAASGGDCEAAFWHQGESDNGTPAATYKTALLTILNNLRTATGRNAGTFNFGIAIVGPEATGWQPTENMVRAIRGAQLETIAEQASNGVFFAGSSVDADLAGDSVHFNTASSTRMGYRYAKSLLKRLGFVAYGSEGPQITSATRSGAVVTVNIAHNGGTALADGAGGSGAALLGFRVYDAGSPCTISSTTISGNTVLLTLSATPAGAVTLDYAMANAPYGSTTAPASVVYDNDTVPGDTLGLPLQHHALMAVT